MVGQELQTLLDEDAVKKLLIRLSYGMDERDAAKCRSVLADELYCEFDSLDGIVVPPGVIPADLIVSETIRKLNHFSMTQHVNTMQIAEVIGDEATLTGYVIGSHYLAPEANAPRSTQVDPWSTIGARYDMKARRFADGWRFTAWVWRVLWTRDNDAVWTDVRKRMKAEIRNAGEKRG